MSKYRRTILMAAILISLPSLFLISVGIYKGSLNHIVFWGFMLVIWWGQYFSLKNETKFSFWLSFSIVNICWWPLLLRTIQRIMFVIENGGMDRADGYGSPMAFLIGLVGEQIFFIPLTLAIVFGLLCIRGLNQLRQRTPQAARAA